MPTTDFQSCTRVFDEFDPLSPAQRRHAKTYATGFVAASNKIVAGIAPEVLPAGGKRTLKSSSPSTTGTNSSSITNGLENFRNTVKRDDRKTATSSSTTRSLRKPGTSSPESAGSTITLKATLSGAKASSTPSTPPTKLPIRSPSASTNSKTTRTMTTILNTIWLETSSPDSKKR